MSVEDKRKEVVNYLLERNILLSAEKAEALRNDSFVNTFHDAISGNLPMMPPEVLSFLEDKDVDTGTGQVLVHKPEVYKDEQGITRFNWPDVPNTLDYTPTVKAITTYTDMPKKRSVQDFVQYFNSRYKQIEKMLRQREELSSLMSVNRLLGKNANESVALVGMVMDKQTTKNNNFIITVEDPTGHIKVIVTQRNKDVYDVAKDIVLDEVIGITGMLGDSKVIFANGLILPDIPLQSELKKSPTPGHVCFISDLQIGTDTFLEEKLIKFLRWLRGESGSPEQRALAKQVGYLILGGDICDGIGIFPSQEDFLTLNDIYHQMEQFAEYMKTVPKHIKIIVIPGNHDPVRLAEPQPIFPVDLAPSLYKLPNVTVLTNPSVVNIHSSDRFPGFNCLLYHGMSFDYYAANIDSIRSNGGYERADLIMKFLLQRRHLAPAHTSTLYIPDPRGDPLVISQIPDFFLTGHIHYSSVAQYRSVTMINGSCWQGLSDFQEKLGHKPVWARATLIDLQTRKVKVINFDQ